MKTSFLRTLLTLGALVLPAQFATAEQRGINNLFDQWLSDQPMQVSDFDAQPAAYLADSGTMENMPAEPPHAGDTGSDFDGGCETCSCNDGCSCGGCDCGCCTSNDCGSCDCCNSCGSCDGCSCGSGCSDCNFGECCDQSCASDCSACGCEGCCGDCANYDMNAGMYYAEIQNIFMRAHFSSQVGGKLSEKYEWSPRIVLGYESPNGLGSRLRWWSYSRTNRTVDDSEAYHLDLSVFDAEGTARFSTRRADLVIAGGLRYANFEIEEEDVAREIAADLPGLTFAADGRMAICCVNRSQWSAVCGARWSLLGGDWEGESNDLVDVVYDDNVTTQEIYGGVEYLCHDCNYDLFARLVFEMQNWRSDALGETSATDSIGFIGPAIHCGAAF
jgi:hypothetical protein